VYFVHVFINKKSFVADMASTMICFLFTYFTLDDKYEILHNGLDIRQVRPITKKEYFAHGSTALLDAVGIRINDVGVRLNRLDESERPEKVIVVI